MIWTKGQESLFKGLRLILEGFVVAMHEGACVQDVPIPRAVRPKDSTYCSQKPECIVTTNFDRPVLIPIIAHFFIWYSTIKRRIWCLRRESFRVLLPFYVTWQYLSSSDEERMLRCLRPGCLNAVSHSTTMRHVYDESANFIERNCYSVHFDINAPSNLTEMLRS